MVTDEKCIRIVNLKSNNVHFSRYVSSDHSSIVMRAEIQIENADMMKARNSITTTYAYPTSWISWWRQRGVLILLLLLLLILILFVPLLWYLYAGSSFKGAVVGDYLTRISISLWILYMYRPNRLQWQCWETKFFFTLSDDFQYKVFFGNKKRSP